MDTVESVKSFIPNNLYANSPGNLPNIHCKPNNRSSYLWTHGRTHNVSHTIPNFLNKQTFHTASSTLNNQQVGSPSKITYCTWQAGTELNISSKLIPV